MRPSMTHQEAIEMMADENYAPEDYDEAAELFAALYGRQPDASDGDQLMLWSHCCAYSR